MLVEGEEWLEEGGERGERRRRQETERAMRELWRWEADLSGESRDEKIE